VATARTPGPSGSSVRELTFGEAIREALVEEMRRDPRVVLLGEDVAEAGTPFKVVKGLVDEFGKDRVVDTPISEAGFTGLAVGAAMAGMRPVVDIMFGDFLALIMDQVANQAAKIHYMSGGKWKVPMVVRATMGATRRSAAQHSQSLHAAWLVSEGLADQAMLDRIHGEVAAEMDAAVEFARNAPYPDPRRVDEDLYA
jgi:pyruvate dehydrogenase E1 component beta subunit